MKKVTRLFGAICMMGLLAFVSTSCKKNQENGEMTINVSVPGFSTEGDRAYITTDGLFMWHENDYLRIYNLADEANASQSKTAVYSKIGNSTGPWARFRGPSLGARKLEGYRVFYPIEMVSGSSQEIENNLKNENRQVFKVSDEQEFSSYNIEGVHHYSMVDPKAMPMAVRQEKLTDNAVLDQMFGVASFSLQAANGENMVVDHIVLEDKFFNITGEVSVKLHKVDTARLNGVMRAYLNDYKGFTDAFVENVLAPELSWLGWYPTPGSTDKIITMDCVYEHEDGETKGETLGINPAKTDFNFILRPLALSKGFTLTVYLEGFNTPIVLDETDFTIGGLPCNDEWGFMWAVKPGIRKYYTLKNNLHYPEN